jgi:uncharacterized protein YvpB
MRRSAFVGCWLIAGAFLALAGCHSGGVGTDAGGALHRAATGSAPQPAATSTLRTATLAEATSSPTPTPTETTGASSATPTSTACSPGGRIGIDGRAVPTPTLPASASIQAIHGRIQSLPLDCEARSAVDWAGYFGTEINELDFFHKLPVSDNPNKGFVGNVRGDWGSLPPYAYGIYAGPVAVLLRYYGLAAHAYRGMTWDQLRAETAAGRPVIVWVVGHIGRSVPVTMTVTSGDPILAARYEHTVIFVGYDEKHAAVLDGSVRYAVSQDSFLASWSVLGNMAIVAGILPARPDCAGNAVELIP